MKFIKTLFKIILAVVALGLVGFLIYTLTTKKKTPSAPTQAPDTGPIASA